MVQGGIFVLNGGAKRCRRGAFWRRANGRWGADSEGMARRLGSSDQKWLFVAGAGVWRHGGALPSGMGTRERSDVSPSLVDGGSGGTTGQRHGGGRVCL